MFAGESLDLLAEWRVFLTRRQAVGLVAIVSLFIGCGSSSFAKDAEQNRYYPLPHAQTEAQLRAMTKPTYPYEFRKRGYEARMGLRLFVSADGRVDRVELAGYTGDYVVVAYAANFVRQNWRFRPFNVRGKPRAVVFVVPITFVLTPSKLFQLDPSRSWDEMNTGVYEGD